MARTGLATPLRRKQDEFRTLLLGASHSDPYLALEVAAVANLVKSDTILERNTELQQRFLELAKADWKRQSDIPILESSVRVIAINGIRALIVDIAGERQMKAPATTPQQAASSDRRMHSHIQNKDEEFRGDAVCRALGPISTLFSAVLCVVEVPAIHGRTLLG